HPCHPVVAPSGPGCEATRWSGHLVDRGEPCVFGAGRCMGGEGRQEHCCGGIAPVSGSEGATKDVVVGVTLIADGSELLDDRLAQLLCTAGCYLGEVVVLIVLGIGASGVFEAGEHGC